MFWEPYGVVGGKICEELGVSALNQYFVPIIHFYQAKETGKCLQNMSLASQSKDLRETVSVLNKVIYFILFIYKFSPITEL